VGCRHLWPLGLLYAGDDPIDQRVDRAFPVKVASDVPSGLLSALVR